ncbi:hypothetical protein GN956_G25957 [Arapaima gigas]
MCCLGQRVTTEPNSHSLPPCDHGGCEALPLSIRERKGGRDPGDGRGFERDVSGSSYCLGGATSPASRKHTSHLSRCTSEGPTGLLPQIHLRLWQKNAEHTRRSHCCDVAARQKPSLNSLWSPKSSVRCCYHDGLAISQADHTGGWECGGEDRSSTKTRPALQLVSLVGRNFGEISGGEHPWDLKELRAIIRHCAGVTRKADDEKQLNECAALGSGGDREATLCSSTPGAPARGGQPSLAGFTAASSCHRPPRLPRYCP